MSGFFRNWYCLKSVTAGTAHSNKEDLVLGKFSLPSEIDLNLRQALLTTIQMNWSFPVCYQESKPVL